MKPTEAKASGGSLLEELVDAWDRASSRAMAAETFSIRGKRVQIRSTDRSLAKRIQRPLAHLRDSNHGPPSLSVILLEGRQLGRDPYRMFGRTVSRSSDPGVVDGSEWRGRFDPREGIMSVLDRARRRALFWIDDPSRLPYWEENAPLRHIFNWWFESEGVRIVHAAGVGTSSGGALVVGSAGSGKSTVALSCLGSGLRCAGDDYQLVQTSGAPHAFSLYSCFKLERDNVARFPRLAGLGEMVEGKERLFLAEIFPNELIRDFPIRAVLVPKVVDGTSKLVPISAGRALVALAPSSIMQLHAVQSDPLGALASIVSNAGTFRLELGRDIVNLPSLVRQALE